MYLVHFVNFFSSLTGPLSQTSFCKIFTVVWSRRKPENTMLHSFLGFSIPSEENRITVIITSVGAIHCIAAG